MKRKPHWPESRRRTFLLDELDRATGRLVTPAHLSSASFVSSDSERSGISARWTYPWVFVFLSHSHSFLSSLLYSSFFVLSVSTDNRLTNSLKCTEKEIRPQSDCLFNSAKSNRSTGSSMWIPKKRNKAHRRVKGKHQSKEYRIATIRHRTTFHRREKQNERKPGKQWRQGRKELYIALMIKRTTSDGWQTQQQEYLSKILLT